MTTRAASKNKNKKPLETTLGKAPAYITDEPIDLSHIRKPIDTSIFGLKQVLTLFETATEEVRKYITYECDIMYECRVCRTIFRSLANFILHKRNYCRESYNRNDHTNCRNNCQENEFNIINSENVEMNSAVVHKDESTSGTNSPIPPKCDSQEAAECLQLPNENLKETKKSLDYILRHLQNKQESALITEQCLSEDISDESKSSEKEEAVKNNVILERMSDTSSGVFQTMFQNMVNEFKGNYMKNEVMEIHHILDNNEAILGKDGRIVVSEYEKNANFMCTVCNHRFSTKKTLSYHIKYKHNNTRLLYRCPECHDTFANAWSVFRHLYKIHRKTAAQVKRLRSQIHSNIIRRDEQPEQKINNAMKMNTGLTQGSQEKVDMENQQWMDDLEGDNDLQRCGGCGRKFERKAALHSHSQFCSKRIAVCNSIKENSAKRVQVEEKQTTDKTTKTSRSVNIESVVKGSQRRKPQNAHRMYRIDYIKNDEKTCENLKDDKALHITLKNCEVDKQLDNIYVEEANNIKQSAVALPSDSEIIKEVQSLNSCSESCNSEDVIYVDSLKTNAEHTSDLNKNDIGEDNLFVANHNEDSLGLNELVFERTKSDSTDIKCIEINNLHSSEDDEKNTKYLVKDEVEYLNNKRKHTELQGENSMIKKIKVISDDDTNMETPRKSLQVKSLKYIDKQNKSCIPCKKTFKSYKSLIRHMAIHFNWYRYQCCNCSFMSYSKSKCERHVEIKHKMNDKEEIKKIVEHIPSTKTLDLSTEFTENCKDYRKKAANKKKKKNSKIVRSSEVLAVNENEERKEQDSLEDQNLDAENQKTVPSEIVTTECDKTPNLSGMENSSLRQMIMEVIFGTENNLLDTREISPTRSQSLKPSQFEGEFYGFENSTTDVQLPPTAMIKDNARPVRNRIPVVQKDFVYDMGQVTMKSKPVIKEKEINAIGSQKELNVMKKMKPVKTYAKDIKAKKTTQVVLGKKPSVNNNSAVEPQLKIVQDVNMNSKDLSETHITGDCD
ncbi:hypothetical protein ILUMI_11658 [Ignelater luminosus]|uniref:C2H2-type domain-containing protein n=1 Tax=Ignelater luminosus TaxID=2038154 RepID=A0A8K0CVP3_IGNLU|nr:hypothetical protein ILUMI_11658 [Ignelater luminosus]